MAICKYLQRVNFAAFQTHTCPNCSKEFSTMGNLRRHMKLTDGCRESGLMPVTNKVRIQYERNCFLECR